MGDKRLPFLNRPLTSAATYVRRSGKLLYTEDQLNVEDPLMKLWRKIAYDKEITYDYFIARYRTYCRDMLGETPQEIENGVGNLRTPLYGKKLTMNRFKEFMETLGLPIHRLLVEVVEDGKTVVYTAF